jgi:uncharacterized protein (DUF433 family)
MTLPAGFGGVDVVESMRRKARSMVMLANKPLVKNIPRVDPENLAGDKIAKDHPLFGLIWINPNRVSGTPCFFATRVPIKNLFDTLAAGESLDDFLDGFEGVTREQAMAVLELAANDLLSDLERI